MELEDKPRKKTNKLLCYNCSGKGHPARRCPSPSNEAVETDPLEDGGEEDEASHTEAISGTGAMRTTWSSRSGVARAMEKWQRFAAVVDSGAEENYGKKAFKVKLADVTVLNST